MNILINGTEYPMATSLRVAYKLQSAQNNKPYMEIFRNFASYPIEQQIRMLYVSYSLANGSDCIKEKEFIEYVLDNYNLTGILELLGGLVDGIMFNGYSEEEIESKKKQMAENNKAQS